MDALAITLEKFWSDSSSLLMKAEACKEIANVPKASVIFETSGSTGIPRKIVLSKQGLMVSAANVNAHLKVSAASVWGLCLPIWHVGGFAVPVRCYQAGCRLSIYSGRWDALESAKWLEREKVTHASMVPTQIFDIVKLGLRAPKSLIAIVVGGGQLAETIGQDARKLGWPVLASYGMTEAGSQIATQALEELAQPYCMDRLSILPCWKTRTNENSILEICGEPLLLGELVEERDGEKTFHPRASAWFTTSDRVELDDHWMSISGRADALVKIMGELVSPQRVTQALIALGMNPASFAVLAMPDERRENRLVLAYDAKDSSDWLCLMENYQQQAPGYEQINEAIAVSEIPRSALGKILIDELRNHLSS
ncbi:MAG: hypothetical protein CAK88_05890 [Verrucomicrobiia bacterium AMD-G2]|nr:MAG: hypothetical protein CAK88_05890 [Verrucomicrobiae bacterium AMD-G2]